jgi:hypothetical protein
MGEQRFCFSKIVTSPLRMGEQPGAARISANSPFGSD